MAARRGAAPGKIFRLGEALSLARLVLAGLGPGDPAYVPVPVITAIQKADVVFLRTGKHPAVDALHNLRTDYRTFDDLYESLDSFSAIYAAMVETVMRALDDTDATVVYVTPGHPLVAEEASHRLLQEVGTEVTVEVLAAPSALEAIYAVLKIDPLQGLEIMDAYAVEDSPPTGQRPVILLQLHDRMLASGVKLALLERYPPDTKVTLVQAAGIRGQEQVLPVELHTMDHQEHYDHLTSLYVPAVPSTSAWDRLLHIVASLRAPGGCPWDGEQDHESLRPYLIEEAYEVIDAIDREDVHNLKEELGDLLLQVVLHAQVATDAGRFTMEDVIEGISQKLVRRHPHVFGQSGPIDRQEAVTRWEEIKAAEKEDSPPVSLVDSPVPGPGLVRARKLQERVATVGFDWPHATAVLEKVQEEVDELYEVHKKGSPEDVEDEIGDVLFSVVNYARHAQVDPEVALQRTVRKFSDRFRHVERAARARDKRLSDMSLEEMEEIWQRSKT